MTARALALRAGKMMLACLIYCSGIWAAFTVALSDQIPGLLKVPVFIILILSAIATYWRHLKKIDPKLVREPLE